MKEEHLSETNKLNEILRDQTKQYENERRSLLVKIDNLSRQMDDQDKAMIVSQQLQTEIQKKEVENAATVGNLNSCISEEIMEKADYCLSNRIFYYPDIHSMRNIFCFAIC
jgi:glucan-binding YG repeat protein